MNFMKKLPFGKKSDESDSGTPKENSSGIVEDFNFNESDVINDTIVEPNGHHSHAKHEYGEHQDYSEHAESVTGSSVDMSPESIISTKHDTENDIHTDTKKDSFSDKLKSIFKGNKSSEESKIFRDDQDVNSQNRSDIISLDIGKKPKPLPIIGFLTAKNQYGFALSLMAFSLVVAGYLSFNSLVTQSKLKEQLNVVISTQSATQSLTLTAQNLVVRSDPSAAGTLSNEKNLLKDSSAKIGKDTDNKYATLIVKTIENEVLPVIDRALKIGSEIGTIGRQVSILERNTNLLYATADQFAAYLQATSSSQLSIAAANDMRVRAERIKGNGIKLLTGNSLSLTPLAEFTTDVSEMEKSVADFSEEKSGLDETSKKFIDEISEANSSIGAVNIFLQKYANNIVQSRIEVVRMRDAVGLITLTGANYIKDISAQSDSYANKIYIALAFLGLGVLSLSLLFLINNRLTKINVWSTAFKNRSNERDIIDFMGEITPLEMGDLTVSFTSNADAFEGITGGIRSSVNEAVISLRDAMSTVKSTTGSVMTNVSESVERSRDLQNSNDRQSKEIEGVVSRVVVLAAAIQEVTDNTVRAAHITGSAKIASDAGAFVVGQTNEKMSEIRGNMQDVLKSVKHLGDTSHEIGLIVEAIETITDRTQVIAVNASLEAAKAGAAGQGFQVLAGEVNRLAEQSNEALRTITALVQRIQGETAATIRVVEESTNNVVEGAKLSESANAELLKISTLSEQLQVVMNSIREQSESQSTNAGGVRESMDRLNALSSEFQSTVSQMVSGVQQIDASMGTLQSTVSIFTTEKAV